MKKLILLALAIPMIANAGLYAEPYLGYEAGDTTLTASGVSTKSDIDGGTTTGARLGYSFLGLMAGYEYSAGSNKFEDGDKFDTDLHGLFVGYNFPSIIPFLGKAWATYNFGGELEDSDSDKYDLDSGYALGVGLAPIPIPLPFISLHINFEMRNNTFESNGTEIENNTYLVSIGVPINI